MAKKKADQKEQNKNTAWEEGEIAVWLGPLGVWGKIHDDGKYPIGRNDLAYVTSKGDIYLNIKKDCTPKEWEYIIAHCMLHLGFGHFREKADPLWNTACDWVVTKFLRESHIGAPLPEFQQEFPFAVKSEEQVYERLRENPEMAYTVNLGLTGLLSFS